VSDRNPFERGWLDALVATELDRHDPTAALARMPDDVLALGSRSDLAPAMKLLVARSLRLHKLDPAPPDPGATFLGEIRRHVALLLDLAVLSGVPFDRVRRRVEIAAFLAAAAGEVELALDALPPHDGPSHERDVQEALHEAERALVARFHPPGDPVLGLPLHPGLLAIFRRRLARVAIGFHRDAYLDPTALARHAGFAARETVLLVEALAALLAADEQPDERARSVRQRQVSRLALPRTAAREARTALATPRPAAELAAAATPAIRPFLVEQLLLARLRARLSGDGAARWVDAFVAAAGLDAPAVAAAGVEAAAQHGDHQVWFEALDQGGLDLQSIAAGWEDAADAVVERVSAEVSFNLGAMMTELRETGELAELLARAASGVKLGAEEKRKVRAQLLDLAKAIPALAIFAAPGGMLLLPLLAKLLPFNVLPGAWDRPAVGAKPALAPASALPPGPAKPGAREPDHAKPDAGKAGEGTKRDPAPVASVASKDDAAPKPTR
jgi:hypothetical protein